jgi:hypothetical protein
MTRRFIAGLIAILWLTSCNPDKLDVDISNVETKPLQFHRLDKDLFSLTPLNISSKTKELNSSYGIFFEHYLMSLLKINGSKDSAYSGSIFSFLGDRDIRGSYRDVEKIYSDKMLEEITPELNNCVKRFKYHFPKRKLPKQYVTCMSGWNYAFAYTDSTLVTALDMYLGDTCTYYQMLQLPKYRTRFMNEHYILSDLIRGWMVTEFDNDKPVNNLLYHTIFYGKIYYAVNALLPDVNDTILMCYTEKQLDYCKKYEKNLWGFFASQNRLYENNMQTIQELTADGPFTGSIHKDCPPRIAMWVGLQIVRSYMKNNEKATLEELMRENDAQKILSKSKYRP